MVTHIYADMQAIRDYGFRDQMQRAGISVMNNIAEGFERQSDIEFARFLNIAKGSAGEVRSMYWAAEDLGFVDGSLAKERRVLATHLARAIASLEGYLRK